MGPPGGVPIPPPFVTGKNCRCTETEYSSAATRRLRRLRGIVDAVMRNLAVRDKRLPTNCIRVLYPGLAGTCVAALCLGLVERLFAGSRRELGAFAGYYTVLKTDNVWLGLVAGAIVGLILGLASAD